MPIDISLLTGTPSQPVSPDAAAGASGSMPAPSAPAPSPDVMTPAMAPPDVTDRSIDPSVPPPPPDAGPAPKQGLWHSILRGALEGMTGTEGQDRGLIGGVISGASGQEPVQRARYEQALQFESVKAADNHTLALKSAQLADLQIAEAKQSLAMNAAKYNGLMSALGFQPAATVSGETPSEIHNAAVGTLPTLAAQNGGKLPGVAAVNDPAGAGNDPSTHLVHVYSPSSLDVSRNPNGTRELIDAVRLMNSQSQTSNQEWSAGYGKGGEIAGVPNVIAGRQKELLDAQQQLTVPVPAVDANRAKMDAANAATAFTLQNQLDAYKRNAYKDAPNYGSIVAYLQNRVDTFKAQADGVSKIATQAAQSDEQARRQGEIAAETSPGAIAGQAKLAGAKAETEAKVKQMFDNKPVYAVDSTGQTIMTTQANVNQSTGQFSSVRPVKESDVRADQHDIKVLNDIQVKSDQVKSAASAMDSQSWGQAIGVANYLEKNPGSTSGSIVNAKVMQGLSPAARAYTINVLSLREAAMGLQKVLTGSARSNETQLRALQATLPGFEANSSVVGQKLDAFNQNLGMLAQGLPTNTGVALQVRLGQALPQTHLFDSQKWAAANPGKDVNAAIAAAKSQGYQVK